MAKDEPAPEIVWSSGADTVAVRACATINEPTDRSSGNTMSVIADRLNHPMLLSWNTPPTVRSPGSPA